MFKKHITLMRLCIKANFMAIPKIVAGMFVFTLLFGLSAWGMTEVFEDDTESGDTMLVAVVYPCDDGGAQEEENRYIEQAFAVLESMDTVGSWCNFETYHDEEQAIAKMQSGDVSVVVVLPENFIHSILYGENTPARIIYPKESITNTSMVFREVIRSATADLSSAQAGVYAVDDAFDEYVGDDSAKYDAQTALNLRYLAYALDRSAYYEEIDVTDMGGSSVVQFYVAAGLLMVLLMCGITCYELLKDDSGVLAASLKKCGISPVYSHICKVLGVTLVLWLISVVLYTLCALSVTRIPELADIISVVGTKEVLVLPGGGEKVILRANKDAFARLIAGAFGLFVMLFSIYSMAGFIFRLSGKAASGVIMLFLLSFSMMYASGCLIPSSMLPPAVAKVGQYMPTYYMFDMCRQLLNGTVNVVTVIINAVFSAVFLGASAFVTLFKKVG